MEKAFQITASHLTITINDALDFQKRIQEGQGSLYNSFQKKVEEAKNYLLELKRTSQLMNENQKNLVSSQIVDFESQIKKIDLFSKTTSRDLLFHSAHTTYFSSDRYIDEISRSIDAGIESGKNTRNNLSYQASKLLNAEETLDDVLISVEDSQKTVGVMKKLQKQKKHLYYVILVLLFVSIIIILYIKIF